jgi:hypothetical protein
MTASAFQQAKKEGYSDEEIVDYLKTNKPEFGKQFEEARASGHSDQEILNFLGGEKKPEIKKVGKAKSILYGLAEGALSIPGLAQYGVNEWSKGIEKALGNETKEMSFEEENPILNTISKFPESEDQTSRRLRVGASGAAIGTLGGIPGIIAGIVGSQAGQTIRELYGKEGKFEKFGWGEASAIGADVLAGGIAGIATSIAQGGRAAATRSASQIPAIFGSGETALERAVIKNVVQGERNALQNIVDNFSTTQIRGFENQAAAISPNRYSELTQVPLSGLRRQADQMFRMNNLNIISPLQVTPEQGGRAIQEAANATFQDTVINAERTAYSAARKEAAKLSGEAPETLEASIKLRDSLVSTNPSGEQNPLVNYLNGLISDLQTVTPARTVPASNLLDVSGKPLIPAQEIAASSVPTKRSANELVDMVQKANQAVNYGSELREQSHRLIPIVNTLRKETAGVLSKNPTAANLFHEANTLHARNAETWGTRYMRNVRFTENPESLVSATEKASNMRNLKQAVPNPTIQGIAERLVVDKITQGGSSSSNLQKINNLTPELSPNARNAAHELINVKDPLTTTGGRAQVRNEILKDAAQSVNTGKRPEKILDLMETPKGYMIVKESLNGSPQGRQIFQAAERLFIEDIFTSITDKSGRIDFGKARNIFKNREVRQVTEMIGGQGLVGRFEALETIANNFERNVSLYSNPQTQSLFKSLFKNVKDAGFAGTILHALHVPWPVIVGLGLGKAATGAAKLGYNALQKKVLSNPEAVRILGLISTANTPEELAKQLPRLITQIEKKSENE